jgi:hypothetical protein
MKLLTRMAACAAAILLFVPTQAPAADDLTEAKRADIKALLEVTGSLRVGQQMSELMVGQMTETLKQARPDIEPRLYDVLRDEVNAVLEESIPAFVELMIPVYHRHFSHREIRELLAFYGTDLGRKTIAVMPLLLQESMQLGQRWGRSLAPVVERRIRERFLAEGVDLSA